VWLGFFADYLETRGAHSYANIHGYEDTHSNQYSFFNSYPNADANANTNLSPRVSTRLSTTLTCGDECSLDSKTGWTPTVWVAVSAIVATYVSKLPWGVCPFLSACLLLSE
jgi:hypothetical protein